MPLDTYAHLLETVQGWLVRDDLATEIQDSIYLAETAIQRELKVPVLEKETSGAAFTGGQDYVDQPADLLEPRFLRIDTSPLRWVNVVGATEFTRLARIHAGATYPVAMTMRGKTIALAPAPVSNQGYTLWYHAGIVRLSEDNPTNDLLTNNADLYLFGTLANVAQIIGDERVMLWQGQFQQALPSARAQEFRRRTGGGPLRVRTDIDGAALPRLQ